MKDTLHPALAEAKAHLDAYPDQIFTFHPQARGALSLGEPYVLLQCSSNGVIQQQHWFDLDRRTISAIEVEMLRHNADIQFRTILATK